MPLRQTGLTRPKPLKKLRPPTKAKRGKRIVKAAGRQVAAEIHEVVRCRTRAEKAVADAHRAHKRLHDAIDILPQGIVFLDSEGRYTLWNKKYAEIYNVSADLFEQGARLEDTLRIGVERGEYPEARGREEEWICERLGKLRNPGERHEQWLSDGRCVLIEEQLTGDGGVIGLRVDITELKQREASFRLLFDANPVPMIVCALEGEKILAVNEAAISHYGYDGDIFITKTIRDLQAFETSAPWSGDGSQDEHAGRVWKHVTANGTLIDVAIYSRQLVHDGQPAMLLAAVDITERKRAEARLAFLAQHDSLTGLPNRAAIRQRLDAALAAARRSGEKTGVICFDIDHFKTINDSLGHSVGDKLLRSVAKRMKSSLREQDIVGRLGADEFVVVQTGISRPEDCTLLAERLLKSVGENYLIEGQNISVELSAGIAMAPGDGDDAERLFKNADLALSRTKNDTRGSFSFFETGMDAKAQARRRLETDLRAAIADHVLQPYYQPVIDLATGRVTGLECLVRWPHPERGMIPPSEFIPVAEESGLIGRIGAYILKRACFDAALWPDSVRVAVNLSPLQFRTDNLLSVVMDALKQSGLPPNRLELEITETLLMDKSDAALATLHALRALGAHISMDDFGTGYSSLSYLRMFPFDKIKIDQSFVRELKTNREAQLIVRAIINLGRSLGVTVTAEGIETASELSFLRAEGCEQGQGFLFSKARPNFEIISLLHAQRMTVEPLNGLIDETAWVA